MCSDSFFQQYNHLRGLVIIERKSKQVSYITSQRKISLIKGNEDNNDNIIKNATSTALHVLCLKHNYFFFTDHDFNCTTTKQKLLM